jgi:hypothetical protein
VQPALASFHHKANHGSRPSSPYKLIETPIRANPLAFGF